MSPSLDPNPGVSELRPQDFWLFRIQAYVWIVICALCKAPGGAAWYSVSLSCWTSPEVSQLRPHGLEALWDSLTPFSQVQGQASAMMSYGK